MLNKYGHPVPEFLTRRLSEQFGSESCNGKYVAKKEQAKITLCKTHKMENEGCFDEEYTFMHTRPDVHPNIWQRSIK